MESSSHPGQESPGGISRMPAVNGVGEPCAGEPHARFEVAGAGNGAPGNGHRSEAARRGNPGKVAAGPNAGQCHRASPRPYMINIESCRLITIYCPQAVPRFGAFRHVEPRSPTTRHGRKERKITSAANRRSVLTY